MLTPLETISLEWLFSALALACVLARLWVCLAHRKYHYDSGTRWVSTVLLVLGLGCAFGSSTCDTLVYKLGALQDYDNPSTYLGQIRFAEKFLFDTGLYLPKLSLVMSYEKMVPRTSRRLRVFLGCIFAYLAVACMAATLATVFWCGLHPSINWLHPQTCSSFTNGRLQKVTWTLNILGELLLLIFPFTIIKSLHFTDLRDKLGLALIFSLGLVTIVVTTGRFIVMLLDVNNIALSVWTTAETSISVMVVATMALAPLLRKVGPSITGNLQKLKSITRWRLRLVKEERPQQPDLYPGKLPMPTPTAVWHKWPVDLDVNSMSVTTMTDTSTQVTQKTSSLTHKSTSTSRSTWSRSIGGKTRLATQVREESAQPEMVSRGVQTLERVVVELDSQSLPFGARSVDISPA